MLGLCAWCRLSLVEMIRAALCYDVWASHCASVLLCWAQVLDVWGFSSCAQGSSVTWQVGSVVEAHRFSCSLTCENFPDWGLNPCPWKWQVDSYSLLHQGSPKTDTLIKCWWSSKSEMYFFLEQQNSSSTIKIIEYVSWYGNESKAEINNGKTIRTFPNNWKLNNTLN